MTDVSNAALAFWRENPQSRCPERPLFVRRRENRYKIGDQKPTPQPKIIPGRAGAAGRATILFRHNNPKKNPMLQLILLVLAAIVVGGQFEVEAAHHLASQSEESRETWTAQRR